MGVAAQKRGDRLIAYQAQHRYTAHDIAVAKRQVARENDLLRKQVDKQETELVALRQMVTEIDMLRANNKELTSSLAAREEQCRHLSGLYRDELDITARWRHSFEKLSAIVRLALTPEQYHRYREVVEMSDSEHDGAEGE